MEGYYVPKIEEFVEGFKYESCTSSTGYIIMYFDDTREDYRSPMEDMWVEGTVPNLDPIEYPHTINNEDGTTLTIMNNCGLYDAPLWRIKQMLSHKQIRVKL